MNDFFAQFISEYGTTILYSLLTLAATALGTWVGQLYKAKVNDEIKRKVVKTCCTAVEQLFKDLKGEAKLAKACESIEAMLAEKNISITALEMRMLIEEVCYDFATAAKEEIAKEEMQSVEDVLKEIEGANG